MTHLGGAFPARGQGSGRAASWRREFGQRTRTDRRIAGADDLTVVVASVVAMAGEGSHPLSAPHGRPRRNETPPADQDRTPFGGSPSPQTRRRSRSGPWTNDRGPAKRNGRTTCSPGTWLRPGRTTVDDRPVRPTTARRHTLDSRSGRTRSVACDGVVGCQSAQRSGLPHKKSRLRRRRRGASENRRACPTHCQTRCLSRSARPDGRASPHAPLPAASTPRAARTGPARARNRRGAAGRRVATSQGRTPVVRRRPVRRSSMRRLRIQSPTWWQCRAIGRPRAVAPGNRAATSAR